MNNTLFLIIILFLSISILSCSASKSYAPDYSQSPRQEGSGSEIFLKENSVTASGVELERKILFSAYFSLIVNNTDTANARILKIADKYNGYANEIGTYRTVIRVRSNRLNEAVREISRLGKVKNKNITGQDVTEEFRDYQIRLENVKKARSRYLELLAKAENVEAALKVERELERLNETIDLLKGKINRLNHLEEFSTIHINLQEKKKPGILGYIGLGLYHSVKWLFVRN